jgi:hypothetical protein
MTTEHDDAPGGANLMILKGVVWGLGVLLLAGILFIAIMIARGPGGTVPDNPQAAIEQVTLAPGESLTDVAAGDGAAVLTISRDGIPVRLLHINFVSGVQRSVPIIRSEVAVNEG